jgi:hypothetical protein
LISPSIFWPCAAGAVFFVVGLFAIRRDLAAAIGLEKLIVLGPLFYAAPLVVFGAEHLVGIRSIMQTVPAWMPVREFWVYFVGIALIAAAVSIVSGKLVRWSTPLLGIMFVIFVLAIHVPNVIANPRSRFLWAIVLRDLSFAAGAWALAGSRNKLAWLIHVARYCIAIPAIFFGVEQLLHPGFALGVPLPKPIPSWIPLHAYWGYLTGLVSLIAGAGMLVKNQARSAAVLLGGVITIIVALLYVPILARATQPQIIEGLNYVADTLLFGGVILLLAAAMPRAHR